MRCGIVRPESNVIFSCGLGEGRTAAEQAAGSLPLDRQAVKYANFCICKYHLQLETNLGELWRGLFELAWPNCDTGDPLAFAWKIFSRLIHSLSGLTAQENTHVLGRETRGRFRGARRLGHASRGSACARREDLPFPARNRSFWQNGFQSPADGELSGRMGAGPRSRHRRAAG